MPSQRQWKSSQNVKKHKDFKTILKDSYIKRTEIMRKKHSKCIFKRKFDFSKTHCSIITKSMSFKYIATYHANSMFTWHDHFPWMWFQNLFKVQRNENGIKWSFCFLVISCYVPIVIIFPALLCFKTFFPF